MPVAGGVSAGKLSAGNAPAQFPNTTPANTTLLQTGSGYFRLSDALMMLDQSSAIAQILVRLQAANIP